MLCFSRCSKVRQLNILLLPLCLRGIYKKKRALPSLTLHPHFLRWIPKVNISPLYACFESLRFYIGTSKKSQVNSYILDFLPAPLFLL